MMKDYVNMEIDQIISAYRQSKGLDTEYPAGKVKLDLSVAVKFADWYNSVKHSPDRYDVRAHYYFFRNETMYQWEAFIKAGYTIRPWKGEGEPYPDSKSLLQDVGNNRCLWVFMTKNGFGNGEMPEDHPMLKPTSIVIDDQPFLHNDVFRAVHDLVGHAYRGNQFGPIGELNAWVDHSAMYSRYAMPAMTNETFAQSAWFNFGPHLRRPDGSLPTVGQDDYIPLSKRPFSDQKAATVPHNLFMQLKESTR